MIWKNKSGNCPKCRVAIVSMDLDNLAKNLIEDLSINCFHEDCNWQGKYEVLKIHLKEAHSPPPKEKPEPHTIIEISSNESLSNISDEEEEIYYLGRKKIKTETTSKLEAAYYKLMQVLTNDESFWIP